MVAEDSAIVPITPGTPSHHCLGEGRPFHIFHERAFV
jgi:hypothetical protein